MSGEIYRGLLAGLAVVGLGALAAGYSDGPNDPPPPLTFWGSAGTGAGEFDSSPDSIARDAITGELYVTDRNGVQVFDADGRFVTAWSVSRCVQVAADPAGGVWVLTWDDVTRYDHNGNVLKSWGTHAYGSGLAVNHLGHVYVASNDLIWPKVDKYDGDGNSLGVCYLQYDRTGVGVAVDASLNVYVAENDQIEVFDPAGYRTALWSIPAEDVTVGPSGWIYATDRVGDEVRRLNSNGTVLCQWGTSGSAQGALDAPDGVLEDPLGNVYVVEGQNYRVQHFGDAALTLAADVGTRALGDVAHLRTFSGDPGSPAFLFVIAVDGVPFVMHMTNTVLNGFGHWTLAGPVNDPQLVGHSLVLRGFALENGNVTATNLETITIS